MDMSYGSIVIYVTYVFLNMVESSNNTTDNTSELHEYYVQKKDKGFPVWMVGVIVLSSIALIVLVATIIQRIMRRRAERHEEYRMAR